MERSQATGASTLNVKAAVMAGLIAGAIFLVVEMLLVATVGGGSAWAPPRMIAAIVMGKDVLPPPATFDFGIVTVAMIVHFVLSVAFAVILAVVIHRMGTSAALLIGAVFGLLLYIVNFYGLTVLFPWFAMARNWISVFAHVLFGVTAAWVYQAGLRR